MEELQKIEQDGYSLSKPSDLLEVGRVLKAFIVKNNLSTKIAGKDYPHVDGWKFAGANFALTAIPGTPVKKHTDEMIRIVFVDVLYQNQGKQWTKEKVVYSGFLNDEEGYILATQGKTVKRELIKPYFAYECQCDIIRLSDGVKVSSGTGFCSNLELGKSEFDEYAVNSMAQTRSIGKGYRNIIGFIMNEAGLESTPAEEMEEERIRHQEATKNAEKPKGKKELPLLTKDQEKTVLKQINSGERTNLDALEKAFTLTDDQRNAFNSLLQSKAKKNENN